MLCREIIAVCSQIHTKHLNTLCGQNAEFVNAKPGDIYSAHWPINGQSITDPTIKSYSLTIAVTDGAIKHSTNISWSKFITSIKPAQLSFFLLRGRTQTQQSHIPPHQDGPTQKL